MYICVHSSNPYIVYIISRAAIQSAMELFDDIITSCQSSVILMSLYAYCTVALNIKTLKTTLEIMISSVYCGSFSLFICSTFDVGFGLMLKTIHSNTNHSNTSHPLKYLSSTHSNTMHSNTSHSNTSHSNTSHSNTSRSKLIHWNPPPHTHNPLKYLFTQMPSTQYHQNLKYGTNIDKQNKIPTKHKTARAHTSMF
jgi:hypothetical protein